MSFDAYHKWLGIPPEKQPPHYYQLLGISVNERAPEVIETAAQRQRSILEENLHGPHRKAASQLIFEIEEAELTLLSSELREEYDRQVRLVLRKQKQKQSGHNLDPDSNRLAGEDSGLMRRYLGIVSVILTGFLIMAYFAYQRPRTEEEKKKLRAQPISVKKQTAPTKPAAAEKTEPPSPAPVPLAITQAEAIEWIFSKGGNITTKSGKKVERVSDLPSGPYEVFEINLIGCDVNDASLPNILPVSSVESLILNNIEITDKSIDVINQMKNLIHLYVPATKITGQGLARLSTDLKLKSIYVSLLNLRDQDLDHLVDYPLLENISVSSNQISGQTLTKLSRLQNLNNLHVNQTGIEDKDLPLLKDISNLSKLLIGSPQLTENTLMQILSDLNQLTQLQIFDVSLTNEGTAVLTGMNNLKQIRLIRTDVSDANVNRLKQALPGAEITVEK